ncbi:MAG TPA: hypothetical protein DEG10_02815 [Leclercia adecarboxylata]|nr:hypothetical protein [Leclercia adecarboxylata]
MTNLTNEQIADIARAGVARNLMGSMGHVRAIAAELLAARQYIADMEAREVILPKLPTLGSDSEWYQGFAAGAEGMRNDCLLAITSAGVAADRIRIKGEG